MNLRKKKPLCNLLIISFVFTASPAALALKSDADQRLNIHSLKQSLDIQRNISTFTKDVVIEQGSIKIKADKVVVIRPNGVQKETYIEAFGNPVTFYQMQDSGKPIEGHAQTVRYDIATQLITLTGKAYLEQIDSSVRGDRITYLVQQQQMEAFSDKGKRVSTVLVPSQLENNGEQKKSH